MKNDELPINITFKRLYAVGSIARMSDASGKHFIKNQRGERIGFYHADKNKTYRTKPLVEFGEGDCSSALVLTVEMECNPTYRDFFDAEKRVLGNPKDSHGGSAGHP